MWLSMLHISSNLGFFAKLAKSIMYQVDVIKKIINIT